MSTNYTENYNLCQWEASDRVLREDFNADNAKLDAALTRIEATAGRADAAAEKAYCPDRPGFVTGRYTGQEESSATAWKKVELGFQPRAVLIWPQHYGLMNSVSGRMYAYGGLVLRGGQVSYTSTAFYITETGFQVRNSTTDASVSKFPNLNGVSYNYIAFR